MYKCTVSLLGLIKGAENPNINVYVVEIHQQPQNVTQ